MPNKTENQQKLEKLAKDILILSRNTLLVNLRFLDVALSQFELIPIEESTILTDGKYILYNPKYILKQYKVQRAVSVRDYLHMVFHCVYRHMFIGPSVDAEYWDVASDIAVENIISELNLKSVEASRVASQVAYIDKIKKEINIITAEKLYAYLKEQYPNKEGLEDLRKCFCADNHELWYMTSLEILEKYGLYGIGLYQSENVDGDDGEMAFRMSMSNIWETIAQRMQTDIELFGKNRGDVPGCLIQNLKAVNREKYDYTKFLKKFAVMGEIMKVNDDEFDYVFYTYGMQLYKNMPLIEPLEYKETKAIKEFVIAIDTSGSVAGELVQKFIEKTYNILKSTESFFTRINLHIIQCDAAIQEDAKITNQREFDEYMKTMKIRGLGGTDFRPVFEYVDELRKNKEFTNLKGLIYFTDGMGVFPAKKPDYHTAFVYIDDDYNNFDVPPWAIKLVLQKNEI